MKPLVHIVQTERFLQTKQLIESTAICSRFSLSKSNRLNEAANLVYTQSYGTSDTIRALRSCTQPYIVHMGGDIWYEIVGCAHRLNAINNVLKKATLIVANSIFLWKIVRSHGFDNVIFLPGGLWGFDENIHGISPQRFTPKKMHREKPLRFVMAITTTVLKKYRGIEILMKNAGEYFKKEGIEVINAGKVSDMEFAYRMADEYEVQFVGNQRDWPAFLDGADVFLHPSMFDCFPRALAEAKCAGLPCIAFQVAGNTEVGDSPVFVDPFNPDEIMHALHTIEDAELRKYLGWYGRKQAIEKTEMHRMDYAEIFDAVLAGNAEKLIAQCKGELE